MKSAMRLRKAGPGKKAFILLVQCVLTAYALLILYPLFHMVMSSLKSPRDIMLDAFSLPQQVSWDNYALVWSGKGFGGYFLNSLLITGGSMLLVVLLGSMAAFGLARYKFRGNTLLSLLFLSGLMLPLKAAVIPLFQIVKGMGLMDNPLSLLLVFTAMGLPSTVFILCGFMKTIPSSLEQAARMDGCNDLRIYRQIILPMAAPSIALVTIYNAVPIWNDFFFPLVFIQSDRLKTLPVGLSSFIGQHATQWDLLFTGLSIAILPMLALYLAMSRYFIQGMTAGAVK